MEPLAEEVRRLVHRLAGAPAGWYAGCPDHTASRAEVLRGLVASLARLGARAGTGQPPDAVPAVLGDHALGDQISLLAHEIAVAPHGTDVIAAARAAVRAARDRL